MSTAECKELLADHTSTDEREWKRISKKTINGLETRIFENRNTGEKLMVVADEEAVYELGPYLFSINPFDENDIAAGFEYLNNCCNITITPQNYWDENDCISDRHQSGVLLYVFPDLVDEIGWENFDEAMENSIIINFVDSGLGSIDAVKETFIKHGLINLPAYQDFLDGHF